MKLPKKLQEKQGELLKCFLDSGNPDIINGLEKCRIEMYVTFVFNTACQVLLPIIEESKDGFEDIRKYSLGPKADTCDSVLKSIKWQLGEIE